MITVDPGVTGTGIAVWYPGQNTPYITHTITPPWKWKDWLSKAEYVAQDFKEYIVPKAPSLVLCEAPEFWTSGKGLASAASQDLLKLTHMVGLIHAIAHFETPAIFRMVEARKWKGQLSKRQVADRIKRDIGEEYDSSHVTDAVGIGLWHKKICFREKR